MPLPVVTGSLSGGDYIPPSVPRIQVAPSQQLGVPDPLKEYSEIFDQLTKPQQKRLTQYLKDADDSVFRFDLSNSDWDATTDSGMFVGTKGDFATKVMLRHFANKQGIDNPWTPKEDPTTTTGGEKSTDTSPVESPDGGPVTTYEGHDKSIQEWLDSPYDGEESVMGSNESEGAQAYRKQLIESGWALDSMNDERKKFISDYLAEGKPDDKVDFELKGYWKDHVKANHPSKEGHWTGTREDFAKVMLESFRNEKLDQAVFNYRKERGELTQDELLEDNLSTYFKENFGSDANSGTSGAAGGVSPFATSLIGGLIGAINDGSIKPNNKGMGGFSAKDLVTILSKGGGDLDQLKMMIKNRS